jgi:hypothetical protein
MNPISIRGQIINNHITTLSLPLPHTHTHTELPMALQKYAQVELKMLPQKEFNPIVLLVAKKSQLEGSVALAFQQRLIFDAF